MQIKNLLFWVLTLSMGFGLQAQDRSWEIGWQLYNSHPVPTALEFIASPGPAFLNGIVIKHLSPGFKQRLSIQYLDLHAVRDFEGVDRCCGFAGQISSYKGVEVSMGIEKPVNTGPLQLYAIFDLGLGWGKNNFGASFLFDPGSIPVSTVRYRSIGAYPGAGANLQIKKRINIAWELRWPGVLYKSSVLPRPGGVGVLPPGEGVHWQKRPESALGVLVSI